LNDIRHNQLKNYPQYDWVEWWMHNLAGDNQNNQSREVEIVTRRLKDDIQNNQQYNVGQPVETDFADEYQ
jgi:hypothetical protein